MDSKLEKYVVLIAFITSFFSAVVLNGVIIAVPNIGSEFGMNNVVQNWIPTLLVFTTTIFTLPSGQVSGKVGSKKTLIIGYSLMVIGFIVCCLSISSEMFLISRIIQGIGISLANVAEMSILVLAISEENRGKAIGIVVAGVYLGTSASPVLCGSLVYYFGWRSIFYLSIPFIVLCIALIILKIDKEWITHKNDKFDYIGAVLYMFGIGLFTYGFTELLNPVGQISIFAGLVLLVLFGIYELRIKTPVFRVRLYENKTFTLYNLAGLCGFFAVMVLSTIFNYYFQYVQGWNPQITGLVLLISPIVMSITAPLAGRLSDRVHPQKIASVGMAVTFVALVILSFLNMNTPIYIIIIAMALQALGMGLFSSPNMNAIMSSVPQEYAPHASASQLTVRAIGQTLSLGLLTLVFGLIMGNLALSAQYAGMIAKSSGIICGICSISCVIAIVTSLMGMRYEYNNG